MQQTRARRRLVFGFALLISITFLLLVGNADSGPFRAVRVGVQDVAASLDKDINRVIPLNGQRKSSAQFAAIEAERDRANADAARTRDLERQVNELSTLLRYTPPVASEKLAARVVAIGTSNYRATVEIDRGEENGVRVGNPVLAPRGLIGRVTQTASKRSTVLLLCDTSSSVGVRAPSGELGVANGTGTDAGFSAKPLQVEYVHANAPIAVGDELLTSGLDRSLYPPGLPVASVDSAKTSPQEDRMRVAAKMHGVPSQLDFVMVLQWTP